MQSGLQQWAIKDSITQENLSLVTFLYDHSLLTIIEQASVCVARSHVLRFTYIWLTYAPIISFANKEVHSLQASGYHSLMFQKKIQ